MSNELRQSFLQAYDTYASKIYRHCFFRLFSREKAEELVQETYMKTWEYLKRGNVIENFKPFLYRVANNLIIDSSRKKKEASLELLIDDNPAVEPTYDGRQDMEHKLLMNDVYLALEHMSTESQRLIIMRFVEDLHPKEIAKILNLTPNGVSVKLHRAVNELKEIMYTTPPELTLQTV